MEDLIDIKENTQETLSNIAIEAFNRSIKRDSSLFEIRNEVITNKQNPRRLAEADKICWEVLFAIKLNFKHVISYLNKQLITRKLLFPFHFNTCSCFQNGASGESIKFAKLIKCHSVVHSYFP